MRWKIFTYSTTEVYLNSHALYGIYERKFSRFKRIQKHSLRNILKDYYKRYEHVLQILESDNLAKRRD